MTATDLRLAFGPTVALAGASVHVGAGEVLALTGRSGSGKTSLLYCLSGIVRPDSGRVRYAARDITDDDDERRSALRRRDFGFVFQFGELVPELTLAENVALPLELNGTGRRAARDRVRELLDALGIADAADRRAAEVSGGQAQRAAVARALAHRPRVVFADEPTGSLDSENAAVVLEQLLTLSRQDGSAVVLVTHDAAVAAAADRTVTMADGVTLVAALAP